MKQEILVINLGSKQFDNEIWPVYLILQTKIFYRKNSTTNVAWKLVPGPLVCIKNQAQPLFEKNIKTG